MHLQSTIILFVTFSLFNEIIGDDVFMKASKNVPRIGRSNTKGNIDEMSKFFMKASKSVPRIGRRNEMLSYGMDSGTIPYPYLQDEMEVSNDQIPNLALWTNLAEKFEYNPDLLSPEILLRLQETINNDPAIMEKIRVKRNNPKLFV